MNKTFPINYHAEHMKKTHLLENLFLNTVVNKSILQLQKFNMVERKQYTMSLVNNCDKYALEDSHYSVEDVKNTYQPS